MSTRILLVDDHVAVRRGLQELLSADLPTAEFGSAATYHKAIDEVQLHRWDLVILDLNLGGHSGLELVRRFHESEPRLPVLIYSMHSEAEFGVRALQAGAKAYITKDSPPEEILRAVRELLRGGRYITSVLADKLADRLTGLSGNSPQDILSDREYHVLQKIAAGKTVTQIADEMSLSIKTVSTYRKRILEKLNLTTTAELVRYAIKNNVT